MLIYRSGEVLYKVVIDHVSSDKIGLPELVLHDSVFGIFLD